MTDKILNIHQRLHAIMRDVSYIQKGNVKVNKQYTFVSHDAVTAKIRPALLKHGVLAVPNFFDISQNGNKTSCSMSMTFICVDKPDDKLVIDCAGFGQGIDTQDKGAGKAMSYAYKYALLKVFALETGDDPERDNIDHVDETQQNNEARGEDIYKEHSSILMKFKANQGKDFKDWWGGIAKPQREELNVLSPEKAKRLVADMQTKCKEFTTND